MGGGRRPLGRAGRLPRGGSRRQPADGAAGRLDRAEARAEALAVRLDGPADRDLRGADVPRRGLARAGRRVRVRRGVPGAAAAADARGAPPPVEPPGADRRGSGGPREPDRVGRSPPTAACGRTSRRPRSRRTPASVSSRRQSFGVAHQRCIVASASSAADGELERPVGRPSAPVRRCQARAPSTGRGSRDVQGWGWNTSKASVPPGASSARRLRSTASRSPSLRRCRNARNGTITSGKRPRSGSVPHVGPTRRSRCAARPWPRRGRAYRRGVDADHRDAGERRGDRHPARSDADLEHRTAGRRARARRRRRCPR